MTRRLRIRDRLFLEGGYYLELNPGTPSAPIAKDGFEIPESQTEHAGPVLQGPLDVRSPTRNSLQNLLNTMNQAFSAPPGQPLSQQRRSRVQAGGAAS